MRPAIRFLLHTLHRTRKEDLGHRAACAKVAQAGLSAATAGHLFLQVKGVGVRDQEVARCTMRYRAFLEVASPATAGSGRIDASTFCGIQCVEVERRVPTAHFPFCR